METYKRTVFVRSLWTQKRLTHDSVFIQ